MQVFREVFQSFIGEFKAYEPLLSDIKREYDTTIEYQLKELDKLESIKANSAIAEFRMAQEIQRAAEESRTTIKILREENSDLKSSLRSSEESVSELKIKQTQMMEEYKRLCNMTHPDTVRLRDLTVKYNDFEQNIAEQMEVKDDMISRATDECNERISDSNLMNS